MHSARLVLSQYRPLAQHATEGQELVGGIGWSFVWAKRHQVLELIRGALLGHRMGQLQVPSRAGQIRFLQQITVPIIEGSQFLAICVYLVGHRMNDPGIPMFPCFVPFLSSSIEPTRISTRGLRRQGQGQIP